MLFTLVSLIFGIKHGLFVLLFPLVMGGILGGFTLAVILASWMFGDFDMEGAVIGLVKAYKKWKQDLIETIDKVKALRDGEVMEEIK